MTKLFQLLVVLAFSGLAAQVSAQDVAAGQKKATSCIGCHGIAGYQSGFPAIYKVPMIAGQGAPYIVSALTAYRKGDRRHPTMRAIAASLSDQDMADLAAFYEQQAHSSNIKVASSTASLPAPAPVVAELLKKGNCVSCHGDNFSKPIAPAYPKLAGQYGDYLHQALKAYQVQNNPNVGRNNAIMAGVAKNFSSAELKQMSEYLATLPTELKTVPQSRFR
jgi:cytochrome c553